MIKKGTIKKFNGKLLGGDFQLAFEKLPDNQDYLFVIADQKKNRNLPYIQYLFSVVLKYLSDKLPGHPAPIALYKYFEEMYAPVHTCIIDGKRYQYRELKTEKSIDVNNVIEKVVEYALNNWGIEVPRNETLAKPENRELYSQAYLNQDIDWNSVISSLNKSKDNERRNEKERI